MLLRIEVFPPNGKEASQTLYVSPSTVANRWGGQQQPEEEEATDDDATVDSNKSNNPNAGLVATIGRKGDVDILFGTDRSISRQHALLRFVAAKTSSRRKKQNNASTDKASGCFMEARTKAEESACRKSSYGVCLVLENKGKSGSYIASRDESHGSGDAAADETANDSDATTDDEGPGPSQMQHYGTATSLTTQLGQVIVSAKNKSSSQKLPPLSEAIQKHFGNETPVRLTKLDAEESQVLDLDGDNSSVLVQFGCAQLPTIQIALIPMRVVFSSSVASSIQDSLRLCGGLVQESLPRKATEDIEGTTHMVTTDRVAVAKQLMAWCYGIPIVSPDFLVALRKHSSLQDPFPLAKNFPAKATDTNAFWDWTPDPNLLSNYIMLSVDPSPEVEQAEGLSRAAGAVVEQLYDRHKKPTKAKVQQFLKRVRELLEATNLPKQVVFLPPKTKSKYSNNNTLQMLKQLEEELEIPPVTLKMLAKTITKQESVLVESKASSNTNNSKDKTADSRIAEEVPDETKKQPVSPQSPEWELRTTEKPEEKGKLEHERKETKTEDHLQTSDGQVRDKKRSNIDETNNDEKTASEENPSRSSKRRRVDRQIEEEEEDKGDFVLAADNDESMGVETTNADSPKSINKSKQTSNKITAFDRSDSNGWFQAAPKDDRERSRLRQRAAEAYQKATGIALEPSASTGERISVDTVSAMTDSTNHRNRGSYASVRQTNTNVPNYKRFRKNLVPIVDREVVTLVDASLSLEVAQEASAEELELQENQRIAEALFRGESMPVKKKRRARN